MTEIDPARFILRCLFEPSPNSLLRQTLRCLGRMRRAFGVTTGGASPRGREAA